jgi:hypothetical protein
MINTLFLLSDIVIPCLSQWPLSCRMHPHRCGGLVFNSSIRGDAPDAAQAAPDPSLM